VLFAFGAMRRLQLALHQGEDFMGWLLPVAIAAITLWVASTRAEDWPARPITMTVAFPAGGSDDILGRIVAARLSELLTQPVNVENVEGDGGVVGTKRAAQAPADGYHIALGTSATHALSQALHKHPPYDALADFDPVALLLEQPFVLIARKDMPNNLQEFVGYARAHDATMQYGSAGSGSATHLVCALFNTAVGIKARHVAYNGGALALRDLAAGRIDFFCPVLTIAIPAIEKHDVQAIAVLSAHRAARLPTLPSAAEQGLNGFAASTWFAIFVPKGTPAPIVAKLRAALAATMETPSVREQLKEIGGEIVAPDRRSPEYLRDFLQGEIQKWVAAIETAGLPPR
jgi:tripartite-type tricarboxylate transporter receptor subunit TctC